MMVTNLLAYSRIVAAPLAARANKLQTWMDSLLVRAEAMPEGEKKGGLPTWAIVVIVVVVLLCLVPICILAILTLLGPAIGNVFSGTVNNI